MSKVTDMAFNYGIIWYYIIGVIFYTLESNGKYLFPDTCHLSNYILGLLAYPSTAA